MPAGAGRDPPLTLAERRSRLSPRSPPRRAAARASAASGCSPTSSAAPRRSKRSTSPRSSSARCATACRKASCSMPSRARRRRCGRRSAARPSGARRRRPAGASGEDRRPAGPRRGGRAALPPDQADAGADRRRRRRRRSPTLDGRLALEWKLDGARVQIHKQGAAGAPLLAPPEGHHRAACPTSWSSSRARRPPRRAIYEGEVIAVADGRPLPFQELMRRFRRMRDVDERCRARSRCSSTCSTCSTSTARRCSTSPPPSAGRRCKTARGGLTAVAPRCPATAPKGRAFYEAALAAGHEGVMAKALDSPYTPGVRGAAWLKIKRSVTLDLVIVAADWGYGRRHGWLSNYHLAARDTASGELVAGRQDVQGPDRRRVPRHDRAAAAAAHRRGARHRLRAPGGRRRGALRRHPEEPALRLRHGAALRPHRPHPRRQGAERGRHTRDVRELYQQQFERSP